MKKIIIISVVVIAVIALVVANILKKEKGVTVDVEELKRGKIMQKVTGSGQIRPEVQVKISAHVAGKIMKLYAEEGDRVKKGQLLYIEGKIKTSSYDGSDGNKRYKTEIIADNMQMLGGKTKD